MPERSDPEFIGLVHRLVTAQVKISIFDDQGRLLWYSPDWSRAGGPIPNRDEPLGLRWLEFIHPHDLERVRAWSLSQEEGAGVAFRAHSGNTRNIWLDCVLIKHRAGRYWLATGDNAVSPTPDCDLGLP